MTQRPNETAEWLAARADSWVDTYKKSMLTPLVLQIVRSHQPASVPTIRAGIERGAGWRITERGLYRTLQRLENSGFLISTQVEAHRTGASRKTFTVTDTGKRFLSEISGRLITLTETGPSRR